MQQEGIQGSSHDESQLLQLGTASAVAKSFQPRPGNPHSVNFAASSGTAAGHPWPEDAMNSTSPVVTSAATASPPGVAVAAKSSLAPARPESRRLAARAGSEAGPGGDAHAELADPGGSRASVVTGLASMGHPSIQGHEGPGPRHLAPAEILANWKQGVRHAVPLHMSIGVMPAVAALVILIMFISGTAFTDFLHRAVAGDAPTSTTGAEISTEERILQAARDKENSAETRRLRAGAWVALALMFIQVAGGMLSNSVGLIALSLHLVSDASANIMSIWATELLHKGPTIQCSFGLQQAGALGIFLMTLLVWVMAMVLMVQAMQRFLDLEPISGLTMVVVASTGLGLRLLLTAALGGLRADLTELLRTGAGTGSGASAKPLPVGNNSPQGRRVAPPPLRSPASPAAAPPSVEELPGMRQDRGSRPSSRDSGRGVPRPLRTSSRQCSPRRSSRFGLPNSAQQLRGGGAQATSGSIFWDVFLGLLLVGVGLLVWLQPLDAGTTAHGTSRWCYADPLMALICISRIVLASRSAVRESLMQLLMACPRNVNLVAFHQALQQVEGVVSLHDHHAWQLGGSRMCSAHIVVASVDDCSRVLRECTKIAQLDHSFDKVTFQVEVAGAFDTSAEQLRLSSTTCHDTSG